MAEDQSERPKRILCLDGGGVRGLSAILILKRIMTRYNRGRSDKKQPWEVFDLICGTSTGGIIAIMLGRLHMSLDECEDAYLRLIEDIFKPKRSRLNISKRGIDYFKAKGRFDHKVLEDGVRSVLRGLPERDTSADIRNETAHQSQSSGDAKEEMLLADPDGECKVFVVAIRQKSVEPVALRSYESDHSTDEMRMCKVWEAVRATSAASTFFKPISIGKYGQTYIDGGLVENNPIARAQVEACELWPGQPLVITSIGTGVSDVKGASGNLINLVKTLKNIATDCDGKWENFRKANQDMRRGGRLFRFSATGLGEVALNEAKQKSLIADRTDSYLDHGAAQEELEKCTLALLFRNVIGPVDSLKASALPLPTIPLSTLPLSTLPLSTLPFSTSTLSTPPLSNIPFAKNPNFTGRRDILSTMDTILSSSNPEYCSKMCLWGLGGIGKTQTVLEYVQQRRKRSPKCSTFWIPAISVDTFDQAYLEIGKLLRIPNISDAKADVKTLVQNKLNDESTGEWLMIVDNADDSDVIFQKISHGFENPKRLVDFLPSRPGGSIIFTTRSHKLAFKLVQSECNITKVAEMSDEEAINLLIKILGENALREIEGGVHRLLEQLCNIPLALNQAASYMVCNDLPVAKYISLFEKNEKHAIQMLSDATEASYHYDEQTQRKVVATTWIISFEKIETENPIAARYLKTMACVLRENIPQILLTDTEDELEISKAIGTLTGYSFITKHENSDNFDMHRLVHLVGRKWLKDEGQLHSQTDDTISRIVLAFPQYTPDDYNIWPDCIPHAIYITEVAKEFLAWRKRANLLDQVGCCLQDLGRYTSAENSFRSSLQLYSNNLEDKSFNAIRCKGMIAHTLLFSEQYTKSETLSREVLKVLKKKKWKFSSQKNSDYADAKDLCVELIGAQTHLGVALFEQGSENYAEAEELYMELKMMISEENSLLSMDHPVILDFKNNFAILLWKQGKLFEAEKQFDELLLLRKKTSGENHPSTLIIMNNLALVYRGQKKYKEAENIFRKLLALKESLLGSEHPSTLISKFNLGSTLVNLKKYGEANIVFRETLIAQQRVLGKHDPATIKTMFELGLTFFNQKEYSEAEKLLHEALELKRKEDLPDTNWSRAKAMFLYGQSLCGSEKYSEAIKIFREALELKRNEDVPYTDWRRVALFWYGKSFYCLKEYSEAIKIFRECLELSKEVLGTGKFDTINTMAWYGDTLICLKEYAEAETVLREALVLAEEVLEENHETRIWIGKMCRDVLDWRISEPIGNESGTEELEAEKAGADRRVLREFDAEDSDSA